MAESSTSTTIPARGFARATCALRIFTGLVWLSNGLAKLLGTSNVDLGFFSFNLITTDAARGIATNAASKTAIAPLGDFYRDIVLPNWETFAIVLTTAELAIGLGTATRLAALGGLLLIGPIWIMLWHAGAYLWEYSAEDLFPLALLAFVPAGRVGGLDARLALRISGRWPF
ncbi:hypothetical protein [Amycolatopsis sp. CA-230715]|uniref:hypothetical protein n=1 Tax=Amycolatopsis sp. CA-230715 TaxID=2745196 RepID=UPI001C01E7B5|nr:hypothetical protein [Amycolatopsis sp. CA-230715]QWF76804.1 hypothetical protein HUW46_00183 [Amycolatopsis sp. CA-230715]